MTKRGTITIALLLLIAAAPTRTPRPRVEKVEPQLTLHIIDDKGAPVKGALASLDAHWIDDAFKPRFYANARTIQPSDDQGDLKIPSSSVFGARQQPDAPTKMFVFSETRKLGLFLKVKPADLPNPIEVKLAPLCLVHGQVDSPDMEAEGHTLAHITASATIKRGLDASAAYESTKMHFALLVPPGDYDFVIGGVASDGATLEPLRQKLHVPEDKPEINLATLSLMSSTMTQLLGKPAPELRGIIEWRNGSPVKLADLKGKVVILDFWAWSCSICIAEMPALVKLHEQYKDNPNLVIIAVHAPNAKNLDEAYAKFATTRQRLWKGFEELPFRVALDSDPRTGTLAAFGIHGVPNTLVIDKNGILAKRFYHAGIPGFAEEIDKMLKAPATRPQQ
jgi:thiol-disulfide isomerase/thioredoxin